MDASSLLWGLFGLFIVLFMGYWLAHAWVIRPAIERIDRQGRFPFLDRIMGPPPEDIWERLRKNREEDAAWAAEKAAKKAAKR